MSSIYSTIVDKGGFYCTLKLDRTAEKINFGNKKCNIFRNKY